eukprot:1088920_1
MCFVFDSSVFVYGFIHRTRDALLIFQWIWRMVFCVEHCCLRWDHSHGLLHDYCVYDVHVPLVVDYYCLNMHRGHSELSALMDGYCGSDVPVMDGCYCTKLEQSDLRDCDMDPFDMIIVYMICH